jgi:hypothetical protein
VGGVAAVPVTVTFRSAGPRTVVATVGDAGALSRAATAIVMPGPATSLALVSAPTAIEAGRTSASPVVVAVTDAFGNGVPAVAIAFRAVTGGAIAPSATTDANGRASASVTGAADNGSYTFEASAPGLGTVSALVQVTGGTTPVAAPPPPAPHASGGGCSTGGGVDGAWAIAAAVAVLRHARRAWQRK